MPRRSVAIVVAACVASLTVLAVLHSRYRSREGEVLAGRAHEGEGDGWLGREAAAVYWLRKLASVQSRVKIDGTIDVDRDGIGEYATILELDGAVGIRRRHFAAQLGRLSAADFTDVGERLDLTKGDEAWYGFPGEVDVEGISTSGGYHYRVFLPDSDAKPGWTHATGPAGSPGLAGGTCQVGIDAAEKHWCAVAWPVTRGESGDRAYFVDETGTVLESENVVARWSGPKRAPTPNCAQPSPTLDDLGPVGGLLGCDGDRWRPWDSSRLRARLKEPRNR
jgi:hypothetical protein